MNALSRWFATRVACRHARAPYDIGLKTAENRAFAARLCECPSTRRARAGDSTFAVTESHRHAHRHAASAQEEKAYREESMSPRRCGAQAPRERKVRVQRRRCYQRVNQRMPHVPQVRHALAITSVTLSLRATPAQQRESTRAAATAYTRAKESASQTMLPYA